MGLLEGLMEAWNADDTVRSLVLHRGSLLQWPKASLVGVHTFETMALNETVLTELLKIWLPQNNTPKTISVDDAREEANCFEIQTHPHAVAQAFKLEYQPNSVKKKTSLIYIRFIVFSLLPPHDGR